MSKFSGELLPELAALVREFSLPLLRYPREYKEALQELGLQDWPELKAKLSTNGAEEVMVYLQSYLDACRMEIQAKHDYMSGSNISTLMLWAKVYHNKHKTCTELIAKL
jgi:hypothetical protein